MKWEELPWFREASRRRRHLVGVSGGADSVALLVGMVRAGFQRLVVCHLDHGLRPGSAADARWVKRLSGRLGCDFEGAREDVAALAEEGGMSMETAGREARHRFFAVCAKRWRCGRLVLAHHADDQAETVLWNLLRGGRGARGMAERQSIRMAGRELEVIRPLLGVRRAELREWLAAEKIGWREDETNAQPVAARNRLRNEIFPRLEEIAGRDVVAALGKAAAADAGLREVEAWAVAHGGALTEGGLDARKLRELPAALQGACVRELLRREAVPDVGREVVDRVLAMLEAGGPAAVNVPGGRRVRRRQGRLWVEPSA